MKKWLICILVPLCFSCNQNALHEDVCTEIDDAFLESCITLRDYEKMEFLLKSGRVDPRSFLKLLVEFKWSRGGEHDLVIRVENYKSAAACRRWFLSRFDISQADLDYALGKACVVGDPNAVGDFLDFGANPLAEDATGVSYIQLVRAQLESTLKYQLSVISRGDINSIPPSEIESYLNFAMIRAQLDGKNGSEIEAVLKYPWLIGTQEQVNVGTQNKVKIGVQKKANLDVECKPDEPSGCDNIF